MSDAFADLWNSSAPISNKPMTPQRLGSTSLGSTERRPQYDGFSLLSTLGSSNHSSRPITPAAPSPPKPVSTAPAGGDAFSSLLSGSLSCGSNTNLTIAERVALVEKQKTEKLLRSQEQARVQAAAWSGLDSLYINDPSETGDLLLPMKSAEVHTPDHNSPSPQSCSPNAIRRSPSPPLHIPPSHIETGPSPAQTRESPQLPDLFIQASTIGVGLLNKGLGLWAQGKEKAQKMYEERAAVAAAAGDGSGRAISDRRPAWMRDIPAEEADEEIPGEGGWTDDSNSTFLRGKPKPKSSALPRPPSPLKKRPTVSASHGAISTSNGYKTSGTEKYKLGQFGDAESLYTRAIDALPLDHLLLVPLLNNRAMTRLKNGSPAGAIEDCTSVINLIGPTYVPSREEAVTSLEHGAGVDLGDGLVKAIKRRAEAWEGREKWEDGRKDWEVLAGTAWANSGVRGEAIRGVGRCRKMADATSAGAEEKPKPKFATPKRPPPRPAPASKGPSAALDSLRKQTNAAEAEENLRYELKDGVDAKLAAWKSGKENNIRALIASLDIVLWPELGWKAVGMSELILEKQVKIKYTKAIGKVHPDKLSASNTTLEQRMIANGVFGALSDAWNAFKP